MHTPGGRLHSVRGCNCVYPERRRSDKPKNHFDKTLASNSVGAIAGIDSGLRLRRGADSYNCAHGSARRYGGPGRDFRASCDGGSDDGGGGTYRRSAHLHAEASTDQGGGGNP